MNRLDISHLLSPIASKLEAVEAELQNRLRSETPVASRLAEHVSKSSGKRLRPALLLLVSKFCGCDSDEDIRFGAIFELIHTATLIHDDVIDHASTRRGSPSLNAEWGNTQSVLFGDFLFMQAVHSALKSRNWRMMEIFADVTSRMLEGELIQNEWLYNVATAKNTYFDILERKTAYLFAGCAECGAVLGNNDASICRALFKYGLELGRAFQLVDDLLDFTATSEHLGKPAFSDLHEGKLTLPMLALQERAPRESKAIIERAWAQNSSGITPDDARTLRELLKQHGILDEIGEYASQATKNAASALPTAYGDAEIGKLLIEIPEFLLERTR
jgi:octaprenyl-diphosphate synthase